MKRQYEVVDSSFNRANYSDLIGKVFDNPPGYANVKVIIEKVPMKEIFKLQSRMFQEKNTSDMVEDFVIKSLREGYEKEEIIEGIREFYHQAPEVGNNIFNRVVLKTKGIGQIEQEAKINNWYKKSQWVSRIRSPKETVLEKWCKELGFKGESMACAQLAATSLNSEIKEKGRLYLTIQKK